MGLPLESLDFYYPEELVAAEPAQPRDSARLFVARRGGGTRHSLFSELPGFLEPGDCLVLNSTKVVSARLIGRKNTGGRCEVLLLRELEPRRWLALGQGLKPGARAEFPGDLAALVEERGAEGLILRFDRDGIGEHLESRGLPPLPPYILKRRAGEARVSDKSRYQTVYARTPGSVAAPTAGLHFTPELLAGLARKGVRVAYLTLHVGLGTFKPIADADALSHVMLPESYSLDPENASLILAAREEGRRVVAVGTSTVRTLETLALRPEGLGPGEGSSGLYIAPGFRFRAVDALVTNFHLPRSTPQVLAAAFLGLERLKAHYSEAVRLRYRLFSYGDAMLIL